MYGVRNHSVNFPAGYKNYGKNNPAQNPTEAHRSAQEKSAGRTDQILFSAVKRKDNDALSNLSEEAKSYLATLQEKYPGYSFTIADYETEEEASRLLSQGDGEINVLITPDLLEKMATDETARAKYEGVIDGAKDQFAEIEDQLSEAGKSVIKRLGFTVNADGTTSFYATLKRGITGEDGGKTVKSSLVSEFTDMLNALAESRKKMLEKSKDDPDKPVDKAEQKEKSVMPPKSFEKYRKEPDPYSTEEDYGDLPPESFEKYRKKEEPYPTEEDFGTLPPESFKKYQEEASVDAEAKSAGEEMNYSV
ncbi:MAG: DUF6033 family protein [Bacteroides sp.]|nr:DUF6033 family protein [Bacteroides sp.]